MTTSHELIVWSLVQKCHHAVSWMLMSVVCLWHSTAGEFPSSQRVTTKYGVLGLDFFSFRQTLYPQRLCLNLYFYIDDNGMMMNSTNIDLAMLFDVRLGSSMAVLVDLDSPLDSRYPWTMQTTIMRTIRMSPGRSWPLHLENKGFMLTSSCIDQSLRHSEHPLHVEAIPLMP